MWINVLSYILKTQISYVPPKPKSSLRHLKQGIQEFHRKYVLVPADKAANKVVVCRLHYINPLKQKLNGSHVDDFNTRNKCLTAKLLKQGYRYHKLRKAFSKFYRRHYELISNFNVGLKSLLHQGLSEPEFYGDLVYKFKKIRDMTDFSDQFRKQL